MRMQDYITVSEAATLFGVTTQGMHGIIKKYDVEVYEINPNMFLVPKSELRKIPKERPTGVHIDKRN